MHKDFYFACSTIKAKLRVTTFVNMNLENLYYYYYNTTFKKHKKYSYLYTNGDSDTKEILTWKPEGPGWPCSPLSPAGPCVNN